MGSLVVQGKLEAHVLLWWVVQLHRAQCQLGGVS